MTTNSICPSCKEAAARVCEERGRSYRAARAPGWVEVDHESAQCAAAIRALPEKAGTQQKGGDANERNSRTTCSERSNAVAGAAHPHHAEQNAAPANGGQDVLASDSQESPAAGRCPDAAPMPGMVRRWSFAGESGQWISEKDHEGVMTNYERLFKEVDTLRRENTNLRKRYDGDSKALIEALDRAESAERRVAELEREANELRAKLAAAEKRLRHIFVKWPQNHSLVFDFDTWLSHIDAAMRGEHA